MAELSAQLGYPVDAGAMRTRVVHILVLPSHCLLVAETPDGVLTGWIHAAEQEPLEYGSQCEILGLVVAEEARGMGVGRMLVAEVERWAVGRGLTEVSVRSNVVRTESHPFYKHLGYVRVKTQHAYSKQLVTSS